MSESRPRAGAPSVLTLAAALPVGMSVLVTVWMGRRGYAELSRDYPGILTSLASASLRAGAVLASTVCVGGLCHAVFLHRPAGARRLSVDHREVAVAQGASWLWLAFATALVAVDAADSSGQSLRALTQPRALEYFVQATYLPRAWLVVAAVVLVVVWALNAAWSPGIERSWQSAALLLALGLVATLPPVLVTQVLVGPNHDFGSDAAILGTPAAAVLAGTTVVLFAGTHARDTLDRPVLRRYLHLGAVCWSLVTGSDVVVAAFETHGQGLLSSPTGRLFVVRFVLLALVALVGRQLWRHHPRPPVDPLAGSTARQEKEYVRRRVGLLTVLLSGYLGVVISMTRIPPPQYFVPTSIRQDFLGFDVTARPTLKVLLLDWRVNLLFVMIAIVATGLYLAGARRVFRTGSVWPARRTGAWVSGWALVVVVTSSGVGRYSGASFSVHMLLHMGLNMFAPLLLVRGGPLALALAALPEHPDPEPAGAREWLIAVLGSRLVRGVFHPLEAFVAFFASYYVLYLTGLFDLAMRYHWAHQLMNVDFLVVGYVFFALLVGVDPPPRPLPPIGKLALVLASMPLHAFFAVIVLTRHTVIANTFFQYLQPPWRPDLPADQYLGGQYAWITGEAPLLLVIVLLTLEWARADGWTPSYARRARLTGEASAPVEQHGDAYEALLGQVRHRADPLTGIAAMSAKKTEPQLKSPESEGERR